MTTIDQRLKLAGLNIRFYVIMDDMDTVDPIDDLAGPLFNGDNVQIWNSGLTTTVDNAVVFISAFDFSISNNGTTTNSTQLTPVKNFANWWLHDDAGAAGSTSWTHTGFSPTLSDLTVFGVAFKPASASSGLGLSEEANTALPVTAAKRGTLGIASEASSVLAVTAARRTTLGNTTEADTAQPVIAAKRRATGLPAETDTTLPATVARRVELGIATETDEALPATPAKARSVGIASETCSALAVTAAKRASVGLAEETDTALQVLAPIRVAIGIASEVDSVLPLSSSISKATIFLEGQAGQVISLTGVAG